MLGSSVGGDLSLEVLCSIVFLKMELNRAVFTWTGPAGSEHVQNCFFMGIFNTFANGVIQRLEPCLQLFCRKICKPLACFSGGTEDPKSHRFHRERGSLCCFSRLPLLRNSQRAGIQTSKSNSAVLEGDVRVEPCGAWRFWQWLQKHMQCTLGRTVQCGHTEIPTDLLMPTAGALQAVAQPSVCL